MRHLTTVRERAQQAVRWMGQPLAQVGRWLHFHAWPLGVLAVAILLGQAATLLQQPLVAVSPDTPSFVIGAQDISQSFHLVEPFRDPGYPLFLSVVFQLAGGVDYTAAQTCRQLSSNAYCTATSLTATFLPVVLAQALLSVVAALCSYLLLYRLTGRRVFACLIASCISINLYILAWERSVRYETLSYTWLVLVFLCFERFMRRPRLVLGLLLGVLVFCALMIRPSNLFLPFVLFGLALLRLLCRGELRGLWARLGTWRELGRRGGQTLLPLLAAGAVTAVLLLGYMTLNGQVNRFFGLSYAHNVTLLGKVLEYEMQDLPVDAQYRDVQMALDSFLRSAGSHDPWTFGDTYPQLVGEHFSHAGGYASSIITHHIGTYVRRSLGDLFTTWLQSPVFYALEGANPDGTLPNDDHGAEPGLNSYPNLGHEFGTPPVNEPLWVTALLYLSTWEQFTFLLLPLLLVVLGVRLLRRPKDMQAFLQLALLGGVLGAMAMAAFGNYTEFYRVRSPMDWGMIAVTGIAALEGLDGLARRVSRKQRGQLLPQMGARSGAFPAREPAAAD